MEESTRLRLEQAGVKIQTAAGESRKMEERH